MTQIMNITLAKWDFFRNTYNVTESRGLIYYPELLFVYYDMLWLRHVGIQAVV